MGLLASHAEKFLAGWSTALHTQGQPWLSRPQRSIMKLKLFKPLWGHSGSNMEAIRLATDAGYEIGGFVDNDGAACEGVMIAAGFAAGTARLWPEGTSDLTTPSICPHSPTPSADCGAAEAWQTRNGRLAATF